MHCMGFFELCMGFTNWQISRNSGLMSWSYIKKYLKFQNSLEMSLLLSVHRVAEKDVSFLIKFQKKSYDFLGSLVDHKACIRNASIMVS